MGIYVPNKCWKFRLKYPIRLGENQISVLSSLPGSPMILIFWGPNIFPEFQWEHQGVKCKGYEKLQFPTNISL